MRATDFYSEEAYYAALEERVATPLEACREYAANVGAERREVAWILTDFDSWERNPYYSGPAVPHPEEDADNAGRGE